MSTKPWSMDGAFEDYWMFGEDGEALGVSKKTGNIGVGIQQRSRQQWDIEGAREVIRVLRKYHPELVSRDTLREEAGMDGSRLRRTMDHLSIRCSLYDEAVGEGKGTMYYYGLLHPEKRVRDIDDGD